MDTNRRRSSRLAANNGSANDHDNDHDNDILSTVVPQQPPANAPPISADDSVPPILSDEKIVIHLDISAHYNDTGKKVSSGSFMPGIHRVLNEMKFVVSEEGEDFKSLLNTYGQFESRKKGPLTVEEIDFPVKQTKPEAKKYKSCKTPGAQRQWVTNKFSSAISNFETIHRSTGAKIYIYLAHCNWIAERVMNKDPFSAGMKISKFGFDDNEDTDLVGTTLGSLVNKEVKILCENSPETIAMKMKDLSDKLNAKQITLQEYGAQMQQLVYLNNKVVLNESEAIRTTSMMLDEEEIEHMIEIEEEDDDDDDVLE
eukprot:96188_1